MTDNMENTNTYKQREQRGPYRKQWGDMENKIILIVTVVLKNTAHLTGLFVTQTGLNIFYDREDMLQCDRKAKIY